MKAKCNENCFAPGGRPGAWRSSSKRIRPQCNFFVTSNNFFFGAKTSHKRVSLAEGGGVPKRTSCSSFASKLPASDHLAPDLSRLVYNSKGDDIRRLYSTSKDGAGNTVNRSRFKIKSLRTGTQENSTKAFNPLEFYLFPEDIDVQAIKDYSNENNRLANLETVRRGSNEENIAFEGRTGKWTSSQLTANSRAFSLFRNHNTSEANASELARPSKLPVGMFRKQKTSGCKTGELGYSLGHHIGKGTYSTVYLANDFANKRKYAVKVYSKARMSTPTRKKIVENEIEILESLSHCSIVKYYRHHDTLNEFHLVFELIEGGSLSQWVKSYAASGIPESVAKPILKKLLDAVVYLHARSICHRDLKLENILLTEDLNPKIIDFGFACRENGSPALSLFCGTPNYMSPEIINKTPYSGALNDCWAFGVLFYRVLAGYFPFSSTSTKTLNESIRKANYKVPGFISAEAKRVIDGLLVVSPNDRVPLQTLKTFKFFN